MISIPFILGFIEKYSFLILNKTKKFQLQIVTLTFILASILIFIFSYFYYEKLDLSFLVDPKAYCSFVSEIVGYSLLRAYYQSSKDYTSIAFAQSSSIWLIFLLTIILEPILGYKNQIEIHNKTNLLFALIFFVGSIGYFYDKIDITSRSKNFKLFIIALILSLTIFFAVRNMQNFQTLTFYSFLMLIIGLSMFYFSIKSQKERIKYKYFKKITLQKMFLLYLIYYGLASTLSVLSALFVRVEFFTLFKRLGQLSAAVHIDHNKHKTKISTKDKFVILFILISLISMYFYLN